MSRRKFWKLIGNLSEEKTTVLVTTHYLDEAEYCHRLALIHAGKLAALGTVDELKSVFTGRAVLELAAPRPGEALDALAAQPWVLETSVFGTHVHAVVADPEDGIRRTRELMEKTGNVPAAVERIPPSLEDVFIHHVEEKSAAPA